LTNEDYDFNYRVRKRGGKVLLNPELVTDYIARGTLSELARQFVRYGLWKVRMLTKQPKSIRPRHAVPPLFLLGVIVSGLLSFFNTMFFILFAAVLGLYLLATLTASFNACRKEKNMTLLPFLVIVFIVMHFSWGGGFLYSLVEQIAGRKN